MEKEDVNLTIAKVSAAAGLLVACQGQKWEGANGEAVEAAAKYIKEVLGK